MIIDILFCVFLLVFMIKGYRKGIIIAICSTVALVIGIIGALKLSNSVSLILFDEDSQAAKWAIFLTYAIVFFILVLGIRLLGKLIEKVIQIAALGFFNRISGAILYGFLISFVMSCLLWIFKNIDFIEKETLDQSKVYPIIEPLAMNVFSLIGSVIPFVNEIIGNLKDFFENLNHNLPEYVDSYR